MFDYLITYRLHKCGPLSANYARAHQYILAGNGVFICAKTRFFAALLPIAPCTVRGLLPLNFQFQLEVPRIPERLLDTVLADARRARRQDGGLHEVRCQFQYYGGRCRYRNGRKVSMTPSFRPPNPMCMPMGASV